MPLPQSPAGCPMDSLLRLLMGPWTTYILWVLRNNGPTRFGELKRRVSGISAKMLTERLRMLEEAGVVFRNYQPTVPPQVTYGLTPRGEELREVLDGLSELALRWQAAETASHIPARVGRPVELPAELPAELSARSPAEPTPALAVQQRSETTEPGQHFAPAAE